MKLNPMSRAANRLLAQLASPENPNHCIHFNSGLSWEEHYPDILALAYRGYVTLDDRNLSLDLTRRGMDFWYHTQRAELASV